MQHSETVEKGRRAVHRRAWEEAFETLSRADASVPICPEDLELLSTAAYLTRRPDEYRAALERAYAGYVELGASVDSARCAFWLGLSFLLGGDAGRANGWLARSRRLIEGRASVLDGYLLLPECERRLSESRSENAAALAADALAIGERFQDRDLVALARHLLGRAHIRLGNVEAGLALLDEAMLPAVAGELSPIVTGIIYCSVIEACQDVFATTRAAEWTDALSHWCNEQPEMSAFSGTCRVRRAEIMQMHGKWLEALSESGRAFLTTKSAAALYRQAEIHRLRGELPAAEAKYQETALMGFETQPGLALLRLAQGRIDAAQAAIRLSLETNSDPLKRARLLPAYAEIMIEAGDLNEAESASRELMGLAERFGTELLHASALHMQGWTALARDRHAEALTVLRRAFEIWQRLDAPYEAARVRALIADACRALGDHDTADLETTGACELFQRLGAQPDLRRIEQTPVRTGHMLTKRELEVLRLVAIGKTNRAIASELFLSERTIDRHVSNILSKLDVPSRAAATASAYERGLL